ncbi:MAG TPA: chlorite dismutase family protein [Candidatus Polarisedimenticolia bacterium]|nr:chlorite dismutase family protein [Candidatus Polarisedimenticolia bacterium]
MSEERERGAKTGGGGGRPELDFSLHAGPPDLAEKGAPVRGVPQSLDKRLFLQLQVFSECFDAAPVVRAVRRSGLDAVVYLDAHDPRGVGVLLMSEDEGVFTGQARVLLSGPPFAALAPRPDFTMMGRTYAAGREEDLEDWLLRKPRRNALNPDWPWHVWYPLRRTGEFNRLSRDEQGKMMLEHAVIGRAYGEAGHAFDIRLECHGIDRRDNEFVLGLVSSRLHPLSRLVKDMRRTRQTAEFIESMGPFFVGRAAYQSPLLAATAQPG